MNATFFSAPGGGFSIPIPNGSTFIFEGNSEDTNTSPPAGAGNDWPTQMQGLAPFIGRGYSFYNFALANDVIADMVSRYPTDVKPLRPTANGGTGGPMSVLVVEGCNNDWLNGSSQVTITAAINSYCQTAQGDGFFVVLVNIVPHGNTVSIDPVRIATNQYMSFSPYVNRMLDRATLLPNPLDMLFYLGDATHGSTQGNFVTACAMAPLLIDGTRAPVSVEPIVVMGQPNNGNFTITGITTAIQSVVQNPGGFTATYLCSGGSLNTSWETVAPQSGAGQDNFWLLNQLISGTRVNGLTLDGSRKLLVTSGKLNLDGCPTSSAGLVSGDIYSIAGALMIVP